MIRIFIYLLFVPFILFLALDTSKVRASVSGPCYACHTMHDSQEGQPMAVDGPHPMLLLSDCMGCHTTDAALPYDGLRPYVKSSTGNAFHDDNSLAGGFFPAIMDGTGNHDGSFHDLGTTVIPAGYNAQYHTNGNGYQSNEGLSCAGSNGCHGDETVLDDMQAIAGGHHKSGVMANTYRMLLVGVDPVFGSGADDYEFNLISTVRTDSAGGFNPDPGINVNIYSAGTATGGATISELCAKCHGVFHAETRDQNNSWIRHPTENLIPAAWEIGASGYSLTGIDYKYNPVGYVNATEDQSSKRVTCLSCHRAHGTEQPDILRFNYDVQQANSTVDYGCLGCHDAQRAP